ncbi:MAG: magnesium transporter, partial [Planctomycetota bacterium]
LAADVAGALPEFLESVRVEDVADSLRNFTPGERVRIFEALSEDERAEVIYETDEGSRETLTRLIPDERLAEVLEVMPPDEAADVVEEQGAPQQEALLAKLDHESAGEIRQLLSYDPDSAGGIMTSEFITVSSDATAREVLLILQEIIDTEVVATIYVIDEQERLEGVISLRELLKAPPEDRVGDFMEEDVITAAVNDDQEEVANLARRYNLQTIPVVDDARRVVGVATIDDLIDVLSEEADEDFARIAGSEAGFTKPQPVLRRAWSRIPWLLLPGMSGLAVAMFVESPEQQGEVMLLSFIPLVMGIAGASGTQASTILVRGMATGELDAIRKTRLLFQESLVGGTVALAIAAIAGLGIFGASEAGLLDLPPTVPIAVSVGVFCGIVIATASGVLLPFAFRTFKIDPALAAGPLITSLIDVLAAVAFLGIGRILI